MTVGAITKQLPGTTWRKASIPVTGCKCEACGQLVTIGQFVHFYDDAGEVHVDCDHPYRYTDDPKARVLLGDDPIKLWSVSATGTTYTETTSVAPDGLREAVALVLLNSDRGMAGFPPAASRGDIPDSDGYLVNADAMIAIFSAAPPAPAEATSVEVAWREGFQSARESLTDDEAYCLTVDVEEDAWRDSASRAALRTAAPDADEGEKTENSP